MSTIVHFVNSKSTNSAPLSQKRIIEPDIATSDSYRAKLVTCTRWRAIVPEHKTHLFTLYIPLV